MHFISKCNIRSPFLLCTIGIYSKHVWFVPLKNKKKSIIVTNVFQKILDKFKSKPNELWVDKGSEFYNRSMQSWVQGNDIEMYSTRNEGKSLVAEMLFEL